MRFDLRTKLTAAVLAAIALLGLGSYFVGAQLIEDQLIGAELDRAADDVVVESRAFFFEDVGLDDQFEIDEAFEAFEAFSVLGPETIIAAVEQEARFDATLDPEADFDQMVISVVDDLAAELEASGLAEPMALEANGSADEPVVLLSFATGLFELAPGASRALDPDDLGDRALVLETVLIETLVLAEDGEDSSVDVRFAVGEADGLDLLAVADVSDTVRNADALRDIILVSSLVALVAGGLGAWVLTGRALRPVSAIIGRVDEISAGTLHERVPEPSGDDEIAHLATTVNSMLDRIETGDRQRRQFVADASHELRTPVAVLRSDADLALRHPDRIEKAELATNVLAESERLGRIVEDLLTLARQDEGQLTASRGPVDLDDLVLDEAARTRDVPIDIAAVGGAQVVGDAVALRRAIGHLIDNASRHATSKVAVAVTGGSAGAEVIVDDDGAGIPPADHQRVFERFTRLDEARNRDHGGAGLGLSVVAATAAAHGGTVTVSDSPLGGARFRLTLTEI